MPSEQDIIDQASKLGELIADHDAAKQLASATKAFEADVNSQRAMADYQRFAQGLQQKAQSGGAIEVEDKRKMEELQQAVITNPLLANMQRAEMDYLDLLRKVDTAIVGAGGAVAPSAAQGPPPAGSPILGG
ncbi:MAG: YlbF family regulator [Phycisphaeraceae bacterium]|nr:YlbF family regulator [Phycisphaeraceae bacterium]